MTTLETLQRFIEGAPLNPGPLAADLTGWLVPDVGFVCARCAGRIMARGCLFPRDAEPCWRGTGNARLPVCPLCHS
jgi:hypothetical protein